MKDKQKQQRAISNNENFESKLSWKRIEAKKLANAISDYVYDNIEYRLPKYKKVFKNKCLVNETVLEFYNCSEQLINFYYALISSGFSIGHIVEGDNKVYKTQTLAHMYSKHRFDPVWNWRKSSLIRSIYYKYIKKLKLWESTNPIHIMLSLPHTKGKYKGKRFYTKELLEHFNILRKYPFWKESVYAGEYGVEVKASPNGNGLHIHLHSFTLLKRGVSINKFREALQKQWKRLIDIKEETQPIIWVETLYTFERKENGQFATRPKPHSLKQKEIQAILQNPKYTKLEKEIKLSEIKNTVRKKIYVPSEIKRIKKLNISEDEKEKLILKTFTAGVLETIKYHFKMDTFIKDKDGNYDILLLHEILENTHRRRLYSRFGDFYKQKELSLTDNDLNKNEEADLEDLENGEVTSKANENLINPHTGEEIKNEDAHFVIFKPEHRTYLSAKSINPRKEVNLDLNIIQKIDTKNIKFIVKMLISGNIERLLLDYHKEHKEKKKHILSEEYEI